MLYSSIYYKRMHIPVVYRVVLIFFGNIQGSIRFCTSRCPRTTDSLFLPIQSLVLLNSSNFSIPRLKLIECIIPMYLDDLRGSMSQYIYTCE